MTDARLGGLGREALVSDAGLVRLGGIAREALVSGVGLSGRIKATSFARAAGSVVFAGVVLSGTVGVQTRARMSTPVAQIALAGRIAAEASARLAQLPVAVSVAGRIVVQASLVLTEPRVAVLNGRLTVTSQAAAGAVVVPALRTRQYAVTINARA